MFYLELLRLYSSLEIVIHTGGFKLSEKVVEYTELEIIEQ